MQAYDAIVIGAGPAGLAVAASLKQQGITSVLILEQGPCLGWRWHQHYDRLHLHTAKYFSHLPGLKFAPDTPLFPSKQQFLDYLATYAAKFELQPLFGREVKRVQRQDNGWLVATDQGECFSSCFLVVATGRNNKVKPVCWPGQERFRGSIIHSRDYKNGKAFSGQNVLVVGAGNSGAEIALDLSEAGAKVSLCMRSPSYIVPRQSFGLPVQVANILLSSLPTWLADRIALFVLKLSVGDLSPYGITRPALSPRQNIAQTGRVPIIDVGTLALIKKGVINVLPGITSVEEKEVGFSDGRRLAFSTIVLATGYEPGLASIMPEQEDLAAQRAQGSTSRAAATNLFYVGYTDPGTGNLYAIHNEARQVARSITEQIVPPDKEGQRYGRFAWIKRMAIHQRDHRNPVNRFLHLACIPFELWGALKILATVEFSLLHTRLDLGLLVIIMTAPLYLLTDLFAGALMVALLVGLWAAGSFAGGTLPTDLGYGALALVLGFVVQTRIGHACFEEHGRDDTKRNLQEFGTTKNPIPLLLIVYYHLLEVLFAAGYRPRLLARVTAYRDHGQ